MGHGNAAHGVTRKSPVCFGFSAVSKGQHGSAVALVSAHQSLASGDGWELHPSMPMPHRIKRVCSICLRVCFQFRVAKTSSEFPSVR